MDREKVIKGLETCIPMKYETNEEKECRHEQCPYGRENYKPMNGCFWDLMSDALAMLKEREPQLVLNIGQQISCKSGSCPKCGKMLNTTCNKRYCGDCGQAVKWE